VKKLQSRNNEHILNSAHRLNAPFSAFFNCMRALANHRVAVGDSSRVCKSSFQDDEYNNLKKTIATSCLLRVHMLRRLLASLSRIPGVREATVVDEHGRLRASLVDDQESVVFEDEVPSALREAEAMCVEAGMGNIDQIWVTGSEGRYGIASMAAGSALIMVCDRASALGRMRHEVKRLRPSMSELI